MPLLHSSERESGGKKDKERGEMETERRRVEARERASPWRREEDGRTERGKVTFAADLNETKQLCPSCSM